MTDSRLDSDNIPATLAAITAWVDAHPQATDVREALAIRLLNGASVSMYGREITDVLSPEDVKGRRRYQIHPYSKMGAGASVVITCRYQGHMHVLLGRKNEGRDADAHLSNTVTLPAGYVDAMPLAGARRATTGDQNLKATAIREALEETGIDLTQPSLHAWPISVNSDHNVAGPAALHTVNAAFHFCFGSVDTLPAIKATDDMGLLAWLPVSAISVAPAVGPQPISSSLTRYTVEWDGKTFPIRDLHGQFVDEATQNAHQRRIAQLGLSLEGVRRVTGEIPVTALGADGLRIRKREFETAKSLSERLFDTPSQSSCPRSCS